VTAEYDSYLIPGENGSLEVGKRLINWVWYCNYLEESPEYKDLMTDSDGHSHHFTLPVGKVQAKLWIEQKKYAKEVLAPQFAELVASTKQPFVQAITDVLSPRSSFMGGKILLVGDAVAGFRPHTAASTSQAAYDAILLSEAMIGNISWDNMEEGMMNYARHMSHAGIHMGNRSQFSHDVRSKLKMQELAHA